MRSLITLFIFVLALPAAERTHAVVPADYFSLATITEVAVSPDGTHVAYAEARWDKAEDNRKSDLWVLATDGKAKPAKLTFDRANDRHIKWSSDSKTLYFLGNRKRAAETKAPFDGKTQVWSLPVTGGSPRAITTVDGGVTGYDLAVKANAVVYSVDTKTNDDDAFARLRATYKLDYGHGVRAVSELHRVSLNDWRVERIYAEKRFIREFAVTQDGKSVAMVTAFDDSIVKSEGESRVDILDYQPESPARAVVTTPPTDAYRKNAASPHAWLENLAWSQDGSKIAFNAIFDGHPAETIVGIADGKEWQIHKLSRGSFFEVNGYGRGTGPPVQWRNERLIVLNEMDGRSYMAVYESLQDPPKAIFDGPVSDKRESQLDRDYNVYGFSMGDRAGTLATNIALKGDFAEIQIVNGSKSDSKKSFSLIVNPHTKSWKLPTVKHITWKAPDGSTVGGVLELPPGYDGKTKLPLVVAIHGGPTTSSKAALEFDPHNGRMYFSTAGYAVLCPNYRGSTGYGDKFVTDLIGRENDIEVKDIIAGVEHLVKEGIADCDRVGVMGWSNGGYLTNCLITRKDLPFKLKAASSGAGIVDTVAEWGFNDEPAYPKVFKKGHPWETPEIYKATSPTYQLGNIKTPTIIHVGGNDVRCPPGHSRMLYRAMKEYLNVPTELCEYPGEPHGLSKWSHRQAKMEWDLAWFEKYLK